MCGIAGIVDPSGRDLEGINDRLKTAAGIQHHRGPDASGIFVGDKIGFAHNRLSILDLSSAGNQPMRSNSGRTTICYNGEVFNFRDLAKTYGLTTRSQSDTEVILEAFEKAGPAIFSQLNGMFAFSLLDHASNTVWLVRDRLGIKPLYFSKQGASIAFASEIKALFTLHPKLERRLRIDALHEWTYFGNALGARTMFEGVDQLEPGHCIKIELKTGKVQEQIYWSIGESLKGSRKDPALSDWRNAAQRTLELLDVSIQRQLVSDVPVGIFLSGGLDSSSIACLASRHSERPLTTYSATFDYDEKNSELALAAEVARICGSDHREIRIDGGMSADVVRKMIISHDLPFSDAANIPLYLMSESIGSTHKVILQGDAGDEMFGGYQRHLTLMKYGKYRPLFRALRGLARLPIDNRRYRRLARILSALGSTDDAKVMALFLTVEREELQPSQIFGATLRRQVEAHDPFERYREVEKRFDGRSLAEKMLLVDKSVILPDIFFQKVDRATMAASVEVRVPFTDNDLVDHVMSLTPTVLMHDGVQKGLLREAMKDVLPPAVLAGKKRGFGVPFGYWVTGVFSEQFCDAIADLGRSHPGLLDNDHIQKLWGEHKTGQEDHGFMFWKILNLALWIQEYGVTA